VPHVGAALLVVSVHGADSRAHVDDHRRFARTSAERPETAEQYLGESVELADVLPRPATRSIRAVRRSARPVAVRVLERAFCTVPDRHLMSTPSVTDTTACPHCTSQEGPLHLR
jgi:hypothetical protein